MLMKKVLLKKSLEKHAHKKGASKKNSKKVIFSLGYFFLVFQRLVVLIPNMNVFIRVQYKLL